MRGGNDVSDDREDTGAGRPAGAVARDAVGLEALGLLASGIAHDFNNILAAVRGNVGLAREALAAGEPDVAMAHADLAEVERAVARASALVRQLLAFGRRQARAPEPLDLNALVREAAGLLRALVGEEIRVVLRLPPDLPPSYADRSQVEQVLMNLVLNGRDAIVDAATSAGEDTAASVAQKGGLPMRGGTLTIATGVEHVVDADVARAGVPAPGEYGVLTVSDDGMGMSEATRARIFEPFFTTKPPDRGTGLGLAAAWGIVRQSGGGIRVDSVLGRGSTFVVYLPTAARGVGLQDAVPIADDSAPEVSTPLAARGSARGPTRAATSVPPAAGGADPASAPRTVLLAEDDHAVRRMTGRILRNAGYRVLEAGDGLSALALWRTYADEVDVLVADVRMPHLRGDTLAAQVLAERANFPVVLVTGFAEEPTGGESAGDAAAPRGAGLLAKPFAAADLLAHVAAALAAGAENAVGTTPVSRPVTP